MTAEQIKEAILLGKEDRAAGYIDIDSVFTLYEWNNYMLMLSCAEKMVKIMELKEKDKLDRVYEAIKEGNGFRAIGYIQGYNACLKEIKDMVSK